MTKTVEPGVAGFARHAIEVPIPERDRPRGYLFTEAEARRLAAENPKDWIARKARNIGGHAWDRWMVWSNAADHYVEF